MVLRTEAAGWSRTERVPVWRHRGGLRGVAPSSARNPTLSLSICRHTHHDLRAGGQRRPPGRRDCLRRGPAGPPVAPSMGAAALPPEVAAEPHPGRLLSPEQVGGTPAPSRHARNATYAGDGGIGARGRPSARDGKGSAELSTATSSTPVKLRLCNRKLVVLQVTLHNIDYRAEIMKAGSKWRGCLPPDP
jgi:hypothetical protein